MKIKNLFITLGLAVAATAAVGAGLKVSSVKEVKAASDLYYLSGDFNSWSSDPGSCVLFSEHNSSEVKLLGQSFTANNTFKVLKQTGGSGTLSWISSYSVSSRSGINVYTTDDGYGATKAGIHYNNDTSTNTWNLYFNFTSNSLYVDYAYKLTIGSTNYQMERSAGEEYSKQVTASAGDSVSVTAFNGTVETLAPQDKHSNNITSSNIIKVGGTVDVYFQSLTKSTWVSGYAPSSTTVQDFCDALLELSCDAKDLSGLDWDGEGVKVAINAATVTFGTNVSYSTYGNVVNEAATRYALLVSKGATPITGVTIASSSNPLSILGVNNNNSTLIIVVISALVLVSTGGFFFLRKKQENE